MCCPSEWMEATLNVPSLRATSTESLGDWTWIWFGHVHLNSLVCGLCKVTELTPWHSFNRGIFLPLLLCFLSTQQASQYWSDLWSPHDSASGDRGLGTTRVFSKSHGPFLHLSLDGKWLRHEWGGGWKLSVMALMAADRQGCSIKYKLPS